MFNSRDFHNDFRRSQRTHRIMFRIIATLIALTFVGIVAFWIFAGTMAVKAVGQIEEQGVKGIVEQIWCGKNDSGCMK